MITSPSNPHVKYFKLLKDKKGRQKENKFLVEGPHLLLAALAGNVKIETILYSQKFLDSSHCGNIFDMSGKLNIKRFEVSDRILEGLSEVENSQGVLASARIKGRDFNNFLKDSFSIILLCDRVQDPGNLGSIIRSSDACGISGIIMSKGTVDVYNPKAVRASMGSLFNVPFVYVEDAAAALVKLKEKKFKVISTCARNGTECFLVDLTQKSVIVIGGEPEGISKEILDQSDCMARIPMRESVESLNASVAAGIILYESMRQKNTAYAK